MHVDGAPGKPQFSCVVTALGTEARVSCGIKGYLLIWSQRVSWPALGFHLAPGGYLAYMESDSVTVWSVPGFRIRYAFECRRNPLRISIGKPRVTKFQRRLKRCWHRLPPLFDLSITLWIPFDAAEATGDDNWLLNGYGGDDCGVSGASNNNSNGPVNENGNRNDMLMLTWVIKKLFRSTAQCFFFRFGA